MSEKKRVYQFSIPSVAEMEVFYTHLIGRRISMKLAAKLAVSPRDDVTVATYVNEAGEVVGVAAADITLSVGMSGCLLLTPPNTVKAVIASRSLDPIMWETLFEVYNVSSRFFHYNHYGMVAIDKLYKSSDIPREVVQFARASTRRMDVKMDIPGYGAGGLALMAA